jgi:hypothetical protein
LLAKFAPLDGTWLSATTTTQMLLEDIRNATSDSRDNEEESQQHPKIDSPNTSVVKPETVCIKSTKFAPTTDIVS